MGSLVSDVRTLRFWRKFVINAFAFLGVISSSIQLLLLFYPELDFFKGGLPFTIFTVASLLFGGYRAWPRPIEQSFSSPKTVIRIFKGDLLEENCHIVIGVNDTFDTQTPRIIAPKSVQGQVLSKFFGDDTQELDECIDRALVGKPKVGEILKPGKTTRYGVGAVAPIKRGSRYLFLSAYTEMNEKNEARGTVDGVWKSLLALWQEISVYGNGEAVAVPVIGGGQARLSNILPAQDSIRLIALSFMFASRKERICEELRIVVHPAEFEKLDRMELQSFLSSLRPS
jgi:hypothetical protein